MSIIIKVVTMTERMATEVSMYLLSGDLKITTTTGGTMGSTSHICETQKETL